MSALLRLLWRDPRVLERLQEEQAAFVARRGPQLTGAHVRLCESYLDSSGALQVAAGVARHGAARSDTHGKLLVWPPVLLALCASAGRQ